MRCLWIATLCVVFLAGCQSSAERQKHEMTLHEMLLSLLHEQEKIPAWAAEIGKWLCWEHVRKGEDHLNANVLARELVKPEGAVVPESFDLNEIPFSRFYVRGMILDSGGREVYHLEYFDRRYFPPDETHSGVRGGFPHYFNLSIDMTTRKIVDCYACNR